MLRRIVIDVGASLWMALVFASSCATDNAKQDAGVPHAEPPTQAQHETKSSVQTVVIPSGTSITASLDERLTTETNRAGDQFTATTLEPIVIGGRLVVPLGSCIHGVVRNVQTSGRVEGRAEMTLAFEEIDDVEGKRNAISALPLTLQADSERRDDAGTGDATSGRIDTDLDAGAGAVVVLATEGGHIALEPGRRLNIQMTGPATLILTAEE